MSGTLYRLFDEDGVLLYIGCSISPATRIPAHRDKPWFHNVVSITLEHFDDHDKALVAESQAIIAEAPSHNVRKGLVTEEQLAERRRKREEREEWRAQREQERLEELAKFEAETYFVPGLRCANCGWAGGHVTKGRLLVDAVCPTCGAQAFEVKGEPVVPRAESKDEAA